MRVRMKRKVRRKCLVYYVEIAFSEFVDNSSDSRLIFFHGYGFAAFLLILAIISAPQPFAQPLVGFSD